VRRSNSLYSVDVAHSPGVRTNYDKLGKHPPTGLLSASKNYTPSRN
jgi:hypothetical protein